MPTQAELERLDEQHRLAQARNAGALVLALNATWREVDTANLAATGTQWLTRAIALILGRRRLSTLYALDYQLKTRALQLGPVAGRADLPLVLTHDFGWLIRQTEEALKASGGLDAVDLPDIPGAPAPNVDQIRESLVHTGLRLTAVQRAKIPQKRALDLLPPLAPPEEIERVQRENDSIRREWKAIDELLAEVKPAAIQRSGAAAYRHVQSGGRDATDEVVRTDRKARGYIRIERPACCYFCAMLVSRGPVYADDSFDESDARFTGPGNHKCHDDCGGELRAVYTRDGTEWTSLARETSGIWEEIRKEKGRAPRLNDFRGRWDARNASLRASMQ